jgi:hypothetical protein
MRTMPLQHVSGASDLAQPVDTASRPKSSRQGGKVVDQTANRNMPTDAKQASPDSTAAGGRRTERQTQINRRIRYMTIKVDEHGAGHPRWRAASATSAR